MLDIIRAAIRDHFITTTLIRVPPFHIEERGYDWIWNGINSFI